MPPSRPLLRRALLLGLAGALGWHLSRPRPPAPPLAAPLAPTTAGPVLGATEGGVHVFLGVPYAAPPLGPLRWRPPLPPPAWTGVRAVREPAPACPQAARGSAEVPAAVGATSEDCLYVNVWTPSLDAGAGLPVMVWLHGGAFRVGSASSPVYDGSALAERGAVVVTVGYRLGLLGFFAHPALAGESGDAPADFGLLDQIAALSWVRDNARAFGGDPGNVTVFGESAGGISVLHLMTSPAARGLFHRAIVQSGGGWWEPMELDRARALALAAAEAACLPADAGADALRALPAEDLVAAASELATGLDFGPIEDGMLVPGPIAAAFEAGLEAPVPLILGTNSHEAGLMKGFGIDPGAVLEPLGPELERVRAIYAPVEDDARLARAFWADRTFAAPARWLAERHARVAPTWLYRFGFVPERVRAATPGAGHGAELPYVFGSYERIPALRAVFDRPSRALAAALGDAWVAFARAGDPRCAALPVWPRYDPASDVTLELGPDVDPRAGLDAKRLDFHAARFELGLGAP